MALDGRAATRRQHPQPQNDGPARKRRHFGQAKPKRNGGNFTDQQPVEPGHARTRVNAAECKLAAAAISAALWKHGPGHAQLLEEATMSYNASVMLAWQAEDEGTELPRYNPTTPQLLARFLKKQQQMHQRLQQFNELRRPSGTMQPSTALNSGEGMDADGTGVGLSAALQMPSEPFCDTSQFDELLGFIEQEPQISEPSPALNAVNAGAAHVRQQPAIQPDKHDKHAVYYRKQQTRTITVGFDKLRVDGRGGTPITTVQRVARFLNAKYGLQISTQYSKKVAGSMRSSEALRTDVAAAWNTHMPGVEFLTLGD